jgi:hypothetical protein
MIEDILTSLALVFLQLMHGVVGLAMGTMWR